MSIRVWYNVLLVRFGIRQILPSDYINAIPVSESSEPVVELPDGIIYKTEGKVLVGRKGMIERLTAAARIVSEQGYRLHIFQTYRSPQEQAEKRIKLYEETKAQYPDYSEDKILRMLNVGVAGVGGGHQTGGAVDLSLCDKDGKEIDMGTQYREFNPKTPTRCKGLSCEQQRNRVILLKAMQSAGFVNYPAEWWHYSYGDRMWAAYSNLRTAIYGVLDM